MARTVEMEIKEDVTHTFGKYIKQRVDDYPLVQLVDVIKLGKPHAMIYCHVERDLPNLTTVTYSELFHPNDFANPATIAKFCKTYSEYFAQEEYKARNSIN